MKLFVFFACIALAYAAVDEIPIVRQVAEVLFDGNYHNSFETGNGIVVEEKGTLKNAGNKDTEAAEVTGSFQWAAPDGTKFSVTYIANEEGYQPQGDHLPVPPPIPEYIQKALEWNAAHPESDASSKH